MEKRKDRHSKNKSKYNRRIIIGIIISFSALLAVYLGVTMFFMNHFYFGTTVNCISVAGETVEEVDSQMPTKIEEYTLKLNGRGDMKDQIKGSDINLKYNSGGKIQELKDKQNPLKWITALWDKKEIKIEDVVTYDDKLLKECVDKLSCLNDKNIVEPKNPTFEYGSDGYKIVSEIPGSKIDKDSLYNNIVNAILKGETTLDLDAANCYEGPKYTKDSKEVSDTKDILNKYISTKITYTFGDKSEVLDGSTINKWLKVNENLEVTLDEKEINNYLDKLSSTYNTVGTARDFVTSLGTNIKVSGGDYGWEINKKEELKDLISAIKEGKAITKEPKYIQNAVARGKNDIGNTYVEINLSRQHLWYYKNGSLITEGNVVTGNVSNSCGTPSGIYSLKYKERDAILKGQGYSAPVNYWMPFNGGIGIHDASWRSVFGGNIYLTNGSHGCVNAPYNLASTIFSNIDEGSPIVCYY
ncbi:L,D-transpeptidase/peptidoglycan binding protein [Clostridium sp.]|uniref:L,D-transpeptidase family protein n=1 Tax=Clostridium sp. TaxID=1506 RepID=UPI002627C298|nr:L,D-transpeptidase/peptidoglycan binding protein [Clostridium sp.]